ncbi:hypothetical protein CERSUDRAFT_99347 [Gelatoporia subvermispora B]|uniref:Uncharacterized protein n=1 Tax=Ceriporiopsis subvermispora (strain B) TaxID=914234 RepID=M2Q706_CERS8|nr:hypothetical protein CERSUDRAFT_99347 [Gelatoporia subvermispora B]
MAMTSQQDDEMRRLILPYIICIVRYPFFHAPDIHFDFPIPTIFASASPTALVTPHGFWPIYRHPEAVRERIIHYGLEIDISAPLLSLGARLLFLTLTQRTPWEALPTWPRDREEALARGSQDVDPTQADIAELNANWAMTLYDRSSWDWRSRLTSEEGVLEDDGIWRTDLKSSSSLWDNEWSRLTSCIDPTRIATNSGPVYIPGTLSGLWKGRSTESDIPILQDFIDSETFPETYATVAPATRGHWPIYMRLREHHCISPEVPIPPGGSETSYDDGLCNAWFPTDVALHESNGTVRVQSTSTGFASMYETFVASRSNSHNESTCTVCVNKRRIEEDEITRRIHAEPVTPSSTKSSDRSDVPSTSSPRKIPTQRTENDMEHVREYMNKGIEAGMDIDEVLESELRPHMRMNESDEESNSSRHSSNGDSLTDTVCSGIQDIIVTGELGDTSFIMVVCVPGMDLLPSFVNAIHQ